MASGGKGGGGSKINIYYGTLAGSLGAGPAWSLEWIIVNGTKVMFNITRNDGEDYIEGTLPEYGAFRFYWGTETQNPDPDLEQFEEQPAYRGQVYIVLLNISFGKNGETNPPNIEVCWRRLPNQTVVSGSPAANDGAFTASPIAVAAEVLTSWDWAGQNPAKLNAASFQAVADELHSEVPEGGERSFCAVAPLWNEKMDLKAALADLASISGAWFRLGTDGRIEAGRWRRDGSMTGVTALTINDCTEVPDIKQIGTLDDLPNQFLVEFRDSAKHHKTNCTTPANSASVRTTGSTRTQVAKRPMLLLWDQAMRHANDLLRENSQPPVRIVVQVRRKKAVNEDGSPIRPGDYFTFPIQLLQSDTADVRLFRCTRRSFDPTGDIELHGELETNGQVSAVAPEPVITENPAVVPPLYYRRIVALNRETSEDSQPVYLLAARPGNLVTGVNVLFDEDTSGDFPTISGQSAFAVPVSLNQSLSNVASTARVTLLPRSGGIDPQRDADLLRAWAGGEIEGANDELLLVLLKKDGSGNIVLQSDGETPFLEVLSVNGPATVVGSDTFDVPVLRGRRGTDAIAFTAGSFPDNFATYEGWLCLRSQMVPITHAKFGTLIENEDTAYFRYAPYGNAGVYDPALANAERTRLAAAGDPLGEYVNQTSTAHQPTDAFNFPPNILPPIISTEAQFVSFVFTRSATAPDTPVGGSYVDPIPDEVVGQPEWTDGIPAGTDDLWLSKRRFTASGMDQDATWSEPVNLSGDNANIQVQYSSVASSPGNPTTDPANWSTTASTSTIWMAVRVFTAGAWSAWEVSKVKGETGSQGPQGPQGNQGPQGPQGPQGIPGLDGHLTYYSNEASPPSSPNVGDTWWVIDKAYEYRRWNGTSWQTPTANTAFEIVGGITYIKQAAIREVSAGAIVAGNITAALSLTSGGKLTAGSGSNKFEADSTGALFGEGSGLNFKFMVDSNIAGLYLRSSTTNKAFFGVHSTTGIVTLDLGGTSSNIQNVGTVGAHTVKAFNTLDNGSADMPLYSGGGAYVTGTVSANGFNKRSSRRYKTNVRPIRGALATVLKLRGVRFDWKTRDLKNDIGFIAEDVAQILPTVVGKKDGRVETVDYGAIMPVIVEAIRELADGI